MKSSHGDDVPVGKSHHRKENLVNAKTTPNTEKISESTDSSSSDESSKSVKR